MVHTQYGHTNKSGIITVQLFKAIGIVKVFCAGRVLWLLYVRKSVNVYVRINGFVKASSRKSIFLRNRKTYSLGIVRE